MAVSNQQQNDEKMNQISLDKKIPIENETVLSTEKNELSVEDHYMIDCVNELDDNETDVDKIAKASHKFLLVAAIKNATKILKECMEDKKVLLDKEKIKKKKTFLIEICYNESLKILKEKLLE